MPHHETCRTACITYILSSVSQDDAKIGMLDQRAALTVLNDIGVSRPSSLRAEAVQPAEPSRQPDMLATLRARLNAPLSRFVRSAS